MSRVSIEYFVDHSGRLGAFAPDWNDAGKAALAVGDGAAQSRLRSFVLDYLEVQLKRKSAKAMIDYLANVALWKMTDDWNVYRLPDTPSLAFAASLRSDGSIRICAISACYRYPDDDPEMWWTRVIEPRVLSLT
ncbi:hypothetical protein L2U69_04995 [Zavarzinia compransoris]|uniref:hypothetical protein n=1 Tax=Zavarzinia marina TaxID=2911065 RepID=UPI001F180B48|nr:hypothetical protein [Zavarzinia marina]MCF4164994.1 hypothetical protein [Zavarzinia marina]